MHFTRCHLIVNIVKINIIAIELNIAAVLITSLATLLDYIIYLT